MQEGNAFEIGFQDPVRAHFRGSAEVGHHGTVGVGRDQAQAAPRMFRGMVFERMNAAAGFREGIAVVHAVVVEAEPTEETRLAAEFGEAAEEISGRAARRFFRLETAFMEPPDQLVQTRRFTMLDRAFDAETKAELSRLNLENASAGDLGRFQQLLVTDYMVIGTVKMYSSPGASYNQWTGVTTQNDGPFLEVSYRVILVPTSQLKWAGTIIVPWAHSTNPLPVLTRETKTFSTPK